MTQKTNLLIWGSGSQAMIYATLAKDLGFLSTIVDPRRDIKPSWAEEDAFVGQNDNLKNALSVSSHYVVAIGGEHGGPRHEVSVALESAGLTPISLIDPLSNIKSTTSIGKAAYVAQAVVINIGVEIGRDTILNTACTIDHECKIGKGVHIMGAAALAGRVTIGDFAVIGTNATILPDVTIGRGAYVGAGAVIINNVPDEAVIVGSPGRILRNRSIGSDPESTSLILKSSP